MQRPARAYALLFFLIAAGLTATAFFTNQRTQAPPQRYIVQAESLAQARDLVIGVGGSVTHELRVISAVGATLTDRQLEALRTNDKLRQIYEDRQLETTSQVGGPRRCRLAADSQIELETDDANWYVTNDTGSTVTIKRIVAFWPKTNEELNEIELNNVIVFSGAVEGVSAAFDTASSSASSPTLSIAPGERMRVEFQFEELLHHPDSYEFRFTFDNDCIAEYPAPPPAPFEGDSDTEAKRTYVSTLVGADALHWENITGAGVTVAIIDTGFWGEKGKSSFLVENGNAQARVLAHYDAIADRELQARKNSDDNGHGSHLASLIASSRHKNSESNGIAPNASIIAIKAFDEDGAGSYADTIRGIDWVIANKDVHNIRVLNLSLSAEPQSNYWDDPLNQAVMAAWRDGIVVVASAGNTGPAPMTIGTPGNTPYIITVGAMTDGVTPIDWSDDTLASFSSTGPTFEAFVKPEIVAPGGHVRGLMEGNHKLARQYPHFHDGDAYYTMSGTSQATAIVSGAVALMLEAEPWLTPDQVKCKLLDTARTAKDASGNRAYSAFQQGAGMIDVYAAVHGNNYDCANRGLDINADFNGTQHFRGPAGMDSQGNFTVEGGDGGGWDGSYDLSEGYLWSDDTLGSDGIPWNDGRLWSDGIPWNDSQLWSDGIPWNDININSWVPQE